MSVILHIMKMILLIMIKMYLMMKRRTLGTISVDVLQVACWSMGARLVEIDSWEKNNFVKQTVTTGNGT